METKRGWPWKKKFSEKIALASLELRQNNEHLDPNIQFKDQSEKKGMSLLQQAEAKIEVLAKQLYTKDEMISEHAKVSEEAILGWEKAESEIANIQQVLNAETHKRLATEDRVSQLQSTLREYMNQLQDLQEQQEEKIHDMVLKKTREWEKACEESQEKINKLKNDLLAAEAENFAMKELLQERAKTIEETKEARNRVDEEVRLLQIKLKSAKMNLTNWKYEMYLIRKELDARNEELKSSKKISEVANKQHLKNMKTIAKLESECERMQLLVRKKLQGSDALAQTRIEVGSGLNTEQGRQRPPRINQAKHDQGLVNSRNSACDMDSSDHPILAKVDENKALRESLYRSKREHKDVRISSFNGISKFKGHTNNFSSEDHNITYNEELSVMSIFEDGIVHNENNGLESWANALESELAQLNKKECTTSSISDITMQSQRSFALMDDFAEMEKFASMSGLHKDSELEVQSHIVSDQGSDVVIKNLCHQLPNGFFNCQSEESISEQDVSLDAINGKETSRELALAMNKVVSLIEVLSKYNYNAESGLNETISYKQNYVLSSSEFKCCVRSLITLCNCFLHDKVDIMDFLAEVASALDWILNYTFSLNGPQITNVQILNLRSGCESKKTTLEERRPHNIDDHKTICSDVDIKRFHTLEKQLKLEKDATKEKWALLKEEVAVLKARLEVSSINAAELKSGLSSAMETKGSLMIDMEKFIALTNELVSHLSDAKKDVQRLEVQNVSLNLPLQDDVQCDKDVKIMHQDLLDRQSRSTGETNSKIAYNRVTLPKASIESSTTKKEKEKYMEATTKKLEECHNTVLSIEKRPNDLGEASDNLTQNSPYTRSPLNNPKTQKTLKTIIDYEDHEDNVKMVGNHESIPQSINHGNQNAFLSSPSPGRFLSLEAWENQEAFPPCSPSISAAKKRENGAEGLGRFFTKKKVT